MITVVIVNYFSADVLKDCLLSLHAKQALEIKLIDNSVDEQEKQTLERLVTEFSNVELLFNSENLGFSKAVNQGAKLAKGDAILLLNPDTVVSEGALDELYAAVFPKDVAIAGPLILFPDGTEQPAGRRKTPTPARAFSSLFGLSRLGLGKGYAMGGNPIPSEAQEVDAVSGSCLLIRKSVFEQLGFMDEGYAMHCEDLDLCMRVKLADFKLMFVPTAVVTHAKGHSSHNRQLWVTWQLHRGMIRYYKKFFRERYPKPLWWLIVAGVYLRFSLLSSYQVIRKVFKR